VTSSKSESFSVMPSQENPRNSVNLFKFWIQVLSSIIDFFNLFRPAVFMTFFLVWINFFTPNFNALTLTVSRYEIDSAWKLSWISYTLMASHTVFFGLLVPEDLEAIFHLNWVCLYVNECTESSTFSPNDDLLFTPTDDRPLFHTS
jgi:hypothetical protein